MAVLTTVLVTAPDRGPSASVGAGAPTAPAPSIPASTTSDGDARPTDVDGVRPLPRQGPLAMVPGTPGVNAGNQALQTKFAAGGNQGVGKVVR